MTFRVAPLVFWFAVAGAVSSSCANIESDPDGTETGDGDSETGDGDSDSGDGSGGRLGSASGGRGSGGANASGGLGSDLGGADSMGAGGSNEGGAPPVCEVNSAEACSKHSSEYPLGTAVCKGDGWDLSECKFCVPNEIVPCAALDDKTPDGVLTCDEDGLGWVIEPVDACGACEGAAADCDSEMNPTNNRGGEASCSNDGSYNWAECSLCDNEVTPPSCGDATHGTRPVGTVFCDGNTLWNTMDCTECDPLDYEVTIDCRDIVEQEHDFSGGTAYCDTDASWDQSTCEYCGDGAKNWSEQCDGAVQSGLTCDNVGFVGDSTVIDTCEETCTYDVSVCSPCDLSHQANCLGDGKPEDCQNGACTNGQCGTGSECDMTCEWQQDCLGLSCNKGATCHINCGGGNAECEVNCKPGSNCNLASGNSWTGQISGIFNCADQGECEYRFGVGPDGNVDTIINCQKGSTCTIVSEQYQQDIGVIRCAAGSICILEAAADKNSNFKLECASGASCSACPTGSTCECTGAGCP